MSFIAYFGNTVCYLSPFFFLLFWSFSVSFLSVLVTLSVLTDSPSFKQQLLTLICKAYRKIKVLYLFPQLFSLIYHSNSAN